MCRNPQAHLLPPHPGHQYLNRPVDKYLSDGRGRMQGSAGLNGNELAGVAGEDKHRAISIRGDGAFIARHL